MSWGWPQYAIIALFLIGAIVAAHRDHLDNDFKPVAFSYILLSGILWCGGFWG